jgi:hypothetical protein
MLRKVVSAGVVLLLCVGLALAAETRAVITKVEDGKVTFTEMKGKEKGEEHTLPTVANVKVVKGTYNKETKKFEVGEAIEHGLKNDMFTKIGEKGLGAVIVTDDDNKKITEIRITPRKGKKQN